MMTYRLLLISCLLVTVSSEEEDLGTFSSRERGLDIIPNGGEGELGTISSGEEDIHLAEK